MKEVNIKIRFDDENGKIGFAIERTSEMFDDITETLRLIGALTILVDREKNRIEKTKAYKVNYDKNDDDKFDIWR